MHKKTGNPVDRHVGTRVRLRRMELKMSQEGLGDALGLTFQQVQKYEKGANRIGASRLYQLAGILQVSVGFFFEGLPEAGHPRDAQAALAMKAVHEFMITRDGQALARAVAGVQPELRRDIVHVVERIVQLAAGHSEAKPQLRAVAGGKS